MLLILLPLKPVVSAFIKLSEHCQRATAVHSYLFFTFAGFFIGTLLSGVIQNVTYFKILSLIALVASFLCLSFSVKYYRKHQVRK
jgi:hypothetical protein